LEDLGLDKRIKDVLVEIGCECLDWTNLAHDRKKWWAFVNTGISFGLNKIWKMS
jgi:hypothetical protein